MKKLFKILAVSFIIAMLITAFSINVGADFGDFAGDSDYGDYDDYDYDYDYDDDDDYSYSGGTSSSRSSGGGSDSIVANIVAGIIVAGVLWGVYRSAFVKSKAKKANAGTSSPSAATPAASLMSVSSITQWDPNFSEPELKERLSKLYVQMQNCWSAKDLTPLRGDFTDAQFAQYDRQLQRYRDEGQTSHVERIAVLDVTLVGVAQDSTHDILVANLSTRITTYTIDDKTGNVIRGDKNKEKFMRYEWTLVRPKGAQTIPQNEDSAFNCPNCSAPVNINKSAQCPYCGSVVSKSDYDWVISGIKGLSQRTS